MLSGSKFFVAKVDSKKVKFDANGQAMLSPLRFHYDLRRRKDSLECSRA